MSMDQITVAHGELVLIPLAAQITGHTVKALQRKIERANRGRERGKVNSAFSLGAQERSA